MKQIKKFPNINNCLLYLISIIPLFTLILSSNSSYSRIILVFTLLLLVILYLHNYRIKKTEALVLIINILSILVTLSKYSALGSAITFVNTVLCFKVFNNIEISKKTYITFHLLMGMSLSYYTFTIPKPEYVGHRIYDMFQNSVNTNIISILYLCAFFHIMCCTYQIKQRKKAFILEMIICIIYGYNVWFYGARSAIMSMIIFIISIIIIRRPISYKKYKNIVTLFLLLSLIFPLLYLLLISKFSISEFLGKGIGSRRIIWEGCIDVIKNHSLFGVGNGVSIQMRSSGEVTTSMHNTLLGLWKILGLVPTITFIATCVNHDNTLYDNKKMIVSQLAFISTLLICFFESFYTEELLYMAFLPLLITNVKTKS